MCIVLVNIRNIYLKYSHCAPIHFKYFRYFKQLKCYIVFNEIICADIGDIDNEKQSCIINIDYSLCLIF